MTKIVIEVKGYPQQFYEGKFFGIISDAHCKSALAIIKPCDTITACETSLLLRYWYKNKWVYVSNK